MERFAIINLLELEDRVGGRVEGLQARFARTELDSRDLGVSHFRYSPDFRASSGHRRAPTSLDFAMQLERRRTSRSATERPFFTSIRLRVTTV